MKDYLKDYLAGRRREGFPTDSQGNEVPKVTEAPIQSFNKAFGTFGTYQRVDYPENLEAQSTANPAASSADDPEINWRIEVMLSQIPDKGPLPFLVAREAVEPEAGCCLSCGDSLNGRAGYICGPCSQAKHRALEIAMSKR